MRMIVCGRVNIGIWAGHGGNLEKGLRGKTQD